MIYQYWPSIPANIRSRLTELDQHEYWGEGFAAGNMEYFLVRKNNGSLVLVATSGSTNYWLENGEAKIGGSFDLCHTQTGGITRGTLIGTIDKDTDVGQFNTNRKIPTWTLK